MRGDRNGSFGDPVVSLAHLHTSPSPSEESLALTSLGSATIKRLEIHFPSVRSTQLYSFCLCTGLKCTFPKLHSDHALCAPSGGCGLAKKEEYRHLVFTSGKHSQSIVVVVVVAAAGTSVTASRYEIASPKRNNRKQTHRISCIPNK